MIFINLKISNDGQLLNGSSEKVFFLQKRLKTERETGTELKAEKPEMNPNRNPNRMVSFCLNLKVY